MLIVRDNLTKILVPSFQPRCTINSKFKQNAMTEIIMKNIANRPGIGQIISGFCTITRYF